MANTYPPTEAQRIAPTLINAPASPPKRTAREIAEERWGLRPGDSVSPAVAIANRKMENDN
jgi:hypothetical protein